MRGQLFRCQARTAGGGTSDTNPLRRGGQITPGHGYRSVIGVIGGLIQHGGVDAL